MTARTPRVGLASLVAVFGWVGLTSFGGGRMAYIRHAVVTKRHWLDDRQLLEGITLSQIMPGPNFANISAYLGQRLRGLLGAIITPMAVILPGAVLVMLLTMLYYARGAVPNESAIFKGVGAAVVGLSLATTLQIGVKGLARRLDLGLAATAFLVVGLLHISLVIALLALAPASIWLHRPRAAAPDARPANPAAEERER